MTPLRERMIDDLKLRNRSPRTIEAYTHHVARFAEFHQRSPELLGAEEVRAYQKHLIDRLLMTELIDKPTLHGNLSGIHYTPTAARTI